MVEIQAISALAMTVADADRAQAFYTQALGFKLVSDVTLEKATYSQLAKIPPSSVRLVTLQLGDELIELIEYLDLAARLMPKDSRSNDLWFQHMAIVVSNLDRAYEHVKTFEIAPISAGPQTIPDDNKIAAGVRAFKFRDSDYHSLELIWFPEGKGEDKWQQPKNQPGDKLFLGIDHSAIAVASTEASLRFYRDLLGLSVAGSNLNTGNVQAALDNLPGAEVRVTPLQPSQSSIGVELLDYIKPGQGRPTPGDWQISDLAHRHLILELENLESSLEALRQQGTETISQSIINFPEAYRYNQGCLIKDPSGHALLLVTCLQE